MDIRPIIFTFEGKTLNITENVYEKNNRYYINLTAFKAALEETNSQDKVIKNNYETTKKLKESNNAVYIDNQMHVSLFDFTKALDLKTTWDYKENRINLFKNKEKAIIKDNKQGKIPALIRLEDVAAGASYYDAENLEKLRIMGDMFFRKNIKFHISWIPRYVNPAAGIDNDLVHNYSINNCDFMFTLDYLMSKGGIVGLHGYTHQYGDEESAIGSEFTDTRFTKEKEIRKRIEASIETAKALNIPFAYFESPHYAATEFQMSIIEEYFDYIYEPFYRDYYDFMHQLNPYVSPRNNRTVYIPTPLSYVKTGEPKDVDWMIFKIKILPRFVLASLFYHPTLELPYIKISREENGYPTAEYNEDSILNRIIDALLNKKRVITKIEDI